MKRLARVLLALLLAAPLLEAQDPPRINLLDSIGHDPDGVPTLEDLFLDLAAVLRRADPAVSETIRQRIEWTGKRLTSLERLRDQMRAGVMVDIPEDLRSRLVPGASLVLKRQLEAEVEGLRARYRMALASRSRAPASRPSPDRGATNLSTQGMAVLYVTLDVPEPPETAVGAVDSVRKAASREDLGRTLQRLGDHRGALNAFGAIPEKERTEAVWYRMGQCAEALKRWKDAEAHYGKVIELAKQGVWGRMASHRVELIRKLNALKGGKERP